MYSSPPLRVLDIAEHRLDIPSHLIEEMGIGKGIRDNLEKVLYIPCESRYLSLFFSAVIASSSLCGSEHQSISLLVRRGLRSILFKTDICGRFSLNRSELYSKTVDRKLNGVDATVKSYKNNTILLFRQGC